MCYVNISQLTIVCVEFADGLGSVKFLNLSSTAVTLASLSWWPNLGHPGREDFWHDFANFQKFDFCQISHSFTRTALDGAVTSAQTNNNAKE